MKDYYKFLALDIGDIESFIEEESNHDNVEETKKLLDKYKEKPNIKCFVLKMSYDNELMFDRYKTEYGEEFHMFDYIRDLMKNKSAEVIVGEEFVNKKLVM